MSTAAQILANQANAQHSTGPLTPEGKSRVARNAVKSGLFAATGFIRPGEEETFNRFTAAYTADLAPETALEQTLATEIVRAAWRLRRCAEIESGTPAIDDDADLDRLQTSIDRARASAQRALHRSLAELRRIQTERVYRRIALPADFDPEGLGQTSCRDLDPAALFIKQVAAEDSRQMKALFDNFHTPQADSAKQTQFPASPAVSIARSAPCPCGSGEKYKRCCGKNAPPVLSHKAA